MKQFLVCLALLVCAGLGFAQDGGIAGQVFDGSTGNPIANAVVVAKGDSGIAGQARTNERGVYVIENLAPGLYRVGAEARGYLPGHYPERVGVRAGQITRGIDLRLRPKSQQVGAISGRVVCRRTGNPIPGAVVVARGPNGWGKARTDRHGDYVIRGLETGRYEVAAKAKHFFGEQYPDPVVVQAGQVTERINFALTPMPRKGAIAGRVVDARTGNPIAGAEVVARGEHGRGTAVTDRQGYYRIGDLVPGEYQVACFKRGYHPETFPRPVPVRSGEVTRGVDFRLHRLNIDSD
jgi:protocatechuate 3,4-dioxygenase beta subunit